MTPFGWLAGTDPLWSVVQGKALFTERKEKSKSDDVHLTPSQHLGVLPQTEYMERSGSRVVLNLTGADQMKHVEPDDFVIHLRSFQGGIEHSRYAGKVSNAYTILIPDARCEPRFFRWVLKCSGFIQELNSLTDQLRDGQSIKYSQFAAMELPVPPIDEQRRIADFLDDQVGRIDQAIALRRGQRKLIEQQIRSLITKMVTGGEGAESGAPRRTPAMSVLAEAFGVHGLPSDWQELPLYAVAQERRGNKNTGMAENNLLSLSFGNIVRKDIEGSGGLLPESFDGYQIVESGDLVMRLTDLQNDKRSLRSGLATERGIITSAYLALVPVGLDPRYFAHVMRAYDVAKVLYPLGGGLRQSIGYEDIRRLPIVVPPIEEQRRIADFLDDQVARRHDAMAHLTTSIASFEERKRSLITAVVTGQLDVTAARPVGVGS